MFIKKQRNKLSLANLNEQKVCLWDEVGGKKPINTQDKEWQRKITIETGDLSNGKVGNSLENIPWWNWLQ